MAIRLRRARTARVRTAFGTVLVGFLLTSCAPSDPGERVWRRKCAGCHAGDGRATAEYRALHPFADLTDARWRHGGDRAAIVGLLERGDPKSPMPAYEGRLTREEIHAVARYVLALAPSHPALADAP